MSWFNRKQSAINDDLSVTTTDSKTKCERKDGIKIEKEVAGRFKAKR